jgi:hypothetical protein
LFTTEYDMQTRQLHDRARVVVNGLYRRAV